MSRSTTASGNTCFTTPTAMRSASAERSHPPRRHGGRLVAVGQWQREDSAMTSRVRIAVCDAGPLLVDRSDLMVGDSGPVGTGAARALRATGFTRDDAVDAQLERLGYR